MRSELGTPLWKHNTYDKRSLRYFTIYTVTPSILVSFAFLFLLFCFVGSYLAIVASAIVIVGAVLLVWNSFKSWVLGPSIFSKGISLVSKNPFRLHGRFIKFSEIKCVKIGLDDNVESDVAFLQRYLDNLGSRWIATVEDAMEDMFDSILVETVSEEIIEFRSFMSTEDQKLIRILEEKRVRYEIAYHLLDLMEFLSDDSAE
jgi:hypothetical protein